MKVKPKNSTLGKVTLVSLSDVEIDEEINTSQLVCLRGLTESVEKMGVLNPLQVRRKKGKKLLQVIDGRQRLAAAQKLELQVVPVIDNGYLTNIEAISLSHAENWLRRKTSKKECMEACSLLRKEGLNQQGIATALNLSLGSVSEYLSLARAKPKVMEAALKGKKDGGVPIKKALKMSEEEIETEVQKRLQIILAARAKELKEQERPRIYTNKAEVPPMTQNMKVLMPGETLASKEYRMASDYKERCQKLELEVRKRLQRTPSNLKLQGIDLAIGVLRGKLTVEQALTNWDNL
jgi:ParB/RepB/Spo0J family partition protein